MKLRNIFKRKEQPAKVEVPKEVQEQLIAGLKERLKAKPIACPYEPLAISTEVKFCSRPLLEGSKYCFWHTPDTKKYEPKVMERYFGDSRTLKEALEKEVSGGKPLSGAYLVGASLAGNWFEQGPNIPGARLEFANLSNAHLSYASLKGANLAGAKLENTYLSEADIRDVNFSYAKLHNAKFRQNDFTGVKGLTKESFGPWELGPFPRYRMLEDYPDQCESVYRSLVAYFTSKGALDDASWAAYRSRVVQRKLLKKSLSPFFPVAEKLLFNSYTLGERTNVSGWWRFSILKRASSLLSLLLSYVECYTFGYGEKPLRVVLVGGFAVLLYAILFFWLQAISAAGFWNALYFSIVTFTTLGYGDVTPKPQFRLLAASEGLFGVVLVGLFLFTLSRRAVGRG